MNPHAIFWKKLAVMLSTGVPLAVTLETLAQDTSGAALQGAARSILEGLRSGLSFTEALDEAEVFGQDVVEMVRSAEAQGTLDAVAQTIGHQMSEGVLSPPEAQAPPQTRPEPEPTVTLDEVLEIAIGANASDIHFEPTAEGGRVRFRIDGLLQPRFALDDRDFKGLVTRLKLMSRLDIGERRIPQDGRALVEVGDGEQVDLRIATGPSVLGEGALVRVLRKRNIVAVLSMTDRIFPDPQIRERVLAATERSHGMIMVTGPSGCGKTTSLYSLLTQHDAERHKLISVEDPVEVSLPGVHQVPLQPSLGLFYPSALRHVMRMDPDIIYCAEIRDAETASLLLRSAITGHLVYSQLHSHTAVDALMRFVNIGLEPYLIADATIGVLAQRLVRKLCPDCAAPSPERRERIQPLTRTAIPDDARILGPVGCDACAQTGYRGRRPIQQYLEVGTAMRRALANDPTDKSLLEAARASGMKTLFEHGLDAVFTGETSLDEVLRVCPPSDEQP